MLSCQSGMKVTLREGSIKVLSTHFMRLEHNKNGYQTLGLKRELVRSAETVKRLSYKPNTKKETNGVNAVHDIDVAFWGQSQNK